MSFDEPAEMSVTDGYTQSSVDRKLNHSSLKSGFDNEIKKYK